MSEILYRFSFDGAKFSGYTLAGLIAIWAVVVACTIAEIFNQPFPFKRRLFWICVVVAIPLVGVLAYLPYALKTDELPHFLQSKGQHDKHRQHHKKRSA